MKQVNFTTLLTHLTIVHEILYNINMKDVKFPRVVGVGGRVQLKNGKKARVVMINNAATTPPFKATLSEVNRYLRTYGGLHRGAGPYAATTFQKVSESLEILRRFLGMSPEQAMIFTSNTSSAISLFAEMLHLTPDDVIVTSLLEHTSNNLPWTYNTRAKVEHANVFDDGSLDYADLEKKMAANKGKVKLVAMTGASNLTGYIPDIERISKLAHALGAMLFIDAAQLAPHRPIDMKKSGIDALAFSAHKLYAPFGLGVLVLPKRLLNSAPVNPAGGSIDMISDREILWAPPEVRHQTGTWNVTGVVALAKSAQIIMDFGWKKILQHEKDLVRYAAKQLRTVPGLTLYVPAEKYLSEDRTGNFAFNLKGYHHSLLSAILESEYGIETRAGTICNHRLVRRWLKVGDAEQKEIEKKISAGNRLASYGIVRASLGIHNTKKDIDTLVSALKFLS